MAQPGCEARRRSRLHDLRQEALLGGLGGGVRGGRVLGDWPGLATDKLFEGRDLAITTDYRDFFAEACVRHMGVAEGELAKVFPGHAGGAKKFRGYLGA